MASIVIPDPPESMFESRFPERPDFFNFTEWKSDFQFWLQYHNISGIVDGTIPKPIEPTGSAKVHRAYRSDLRRWELINKRVLICMRSTCPRGADLENIETATQAWAELHRCYRQRAVTIFDRVFEQLMKCSLEASQNVQDFAYQLRSLNDKAKELGESYALPEPWLIKLFVNGLHPELRDIAAQSQKNRSAFRDDSNYLDFDCIVGEVADRACIPRSKESQPTKSVHRIKKRRRKHHKKRNQESQFGVYVSSSESCAETKRRDPNNFSSDESCDGTKERVLCDSSTSFWASIQRTSFLVRAQYHPEIQSIYPTTKDESDSE